MAYQQGPEQFRGVTGTGFDGSQNTGPPIYSGSDSPEITHTPTSVLNTPDGQHHRHSDTKFWMDDPSVLLKEFCIFPRRDYNTNKNLNCLTILVVVTSAVLLLLKLPANYVLIGGLIALVLIAALAKCGGDKEGFARDPHYVDDDFIQTNVTPLVAEEWQFNPPAYELVSSVASDGRDPRQREFGKEYYMEPPFAPYRQYLTRTNLMPNDEAESRLFGGGVTGARTFMNDAFTRHTVAFREDMTRLYKKINNRRFRNLGYDLISPYSSY
jgi:hypothetical protein